MEPPLFDSLAQLLATLGSRRTLLRLLRVVPVAGMLAAVDEEEGAGRGRRLRRMARGKRKRKGKSKGKGTHHQPAPPAGCIPPSVAQTCGGRCGHVTNACGQPIDCGPCDCGACAVCATCNPATSRCEVNPAVVGQACGGTGQVCQADGRCACAVDGCPVCQRCNAAGQCVPVARGTACDTGNPCTSGDTCQEGSCSTGSPLWDGTDCGVAPNGDAFRCCGGTCRVDDGGDGRCVIDSDCPPSGTSACLCGVCCLLPGQPNGGCPVFTSACCSGTCDLLTYGVCG